MSSMPTFLLDVTAYLLLKTWEYYSLSSFRAKITGTGCLGGNDRYGATGIYFRNSAFPENQTDSNPHRENCIAMNPRDVQPGDDTALVVS